MKNIFIALTLATISVISHFGLAHADGRPRRVNEFAGGWFLEQQGAVCESVYKNGNKVGEHCTYHYSSK